MHLTHPDPLTVSGIIVIIYAQVMQLVANESRLALSNQELPLHVRTDFPPTHIPLTQGALAQALCATSHHREKAQFRQAATYTE